jgi:hypothetical protein
MKRLACGAALALALATAGCLPVTYSSISRNADGTFLLTLNKGGFFTVHGVLYHCVGAGNELRCAKIDQPG